METKRETLVILSPGFPANEADSTCMPPQQVFTKSLKETCPGLNIIVLSFQYPYKAGQYEWNGIKVIAIGGKNKGIFFRVFTWIKAWYTLKRLNREYQLIGLLSFWFGECAFVGSYFAKLYKLAHYSWLLGQDARRGNKYFNWIKPQADNLIALSDFVVGEVRKNYGIVPMHVIPVGIDTSLFNTVPAKRDIDIFGAGSLIPLKQYHVFIDTVVALKEIYPNIKAVICGNGPEMERLQAMVSAKGLAENLSFFGEMPHTEVLDLMQRSKIFLHPSNYEGFGSVLSEALYAGAHVVSFCKPMNKEYRHHHVVKTQEQMKAEVLAILKSKRVDHGSVLMCPVQQVSKNMISLFADSNKVAEVV